ncbi:DNA-binding transcriptional ArsR family regulator [Actinoplanes tereljensis]|uniref:hypothetical protein n=1 Tax=Paractinoplanes tereljensis TaxID=571912 RepID=UPI00194575E6|nr:hypothetical protein [Actinoplanes tereljensis]
MTGAPTMKLGHHVRGRLQYFQVEQLTETLPAAPAALHIYDQTDFAWSLPIDLDPSHSRDPDAVRRDAEGLRQLLTAAGGRMVVDESRRGGMHIWAPLSGRGVHRDDIRLLLSRLRIRFTTLDLGPVSRKGCLGGPGSLTRDGSHRRLRTPLREAIAAVTERSVPDLVPRLHSLLTQAGVPMPAEPEEAVALPAVAALPDGLIRRMSAEVRRVAETGRWPDGRTRPDGTEWSPSEARQHVIAAAVRAGMTCDQVLSLIRSGQWAGMAGFYARYGPGPAITTAVTADWTNAAEYVAAHASEKPCPTRGKPKTQGGTRGLPGGTPNDEAREVYRYVRRFALLVDRSATVDWGRSPEGRTRWAILLSLAAAAMRTRSTVVGIGARGLAIGAACIDQRTASRQLADLRDEKDPWIVQIPVQEGDPDRYEVRIPDRYQHLHESHEPLPKGRLAGVHHLFNPTKGLGLAAWRVCAAIAAGHRIDADIIGATGVSKPTVSKALRALSSLGLVTCSRRGWRRTGRSLDAAAKQIGIGDLVAEHAQRNREDRHQRRQTQGRRYRPDGPTPMAGTWTESPDGNWWPEDMAALAALQPSARDKDDKPQGEAQERQALVPLRSPDDLDDTSEVGIVRDLPGYRAQQYPPAAAA